MLYFSAVTGALLITLLFVAVLYIRPDLPRNDPWKIKLRMMGVLAVCCFTWIPVALFKQFAPSHRHQETDVLALLGWPEASVASLQAGLMSVLHIALLFFGPISYMLTGDDHLPYNITRLRYLLHDLATVRDVLVAPLAEEYVFRGCMVPLFLLEGYSTRTTIFIVPLFFGGAHLHHLYEAIVRQGQPWQRALAQVLFQFTYTTLFGWYAVYLFIRMGSFSAPFLSHVFCNIMGVPDFGGMFRHPTLSRVYLAMTLSGIAAFIVGLYRMPSLSTVSWP